MYDSMISGCGPGFHMHQQKIRREVEWGNTKQTFCKKADKHLKAGSAFEVFLHSILNKNDYLKISCFNHRKHALFLNQGGDYPKFSLYMNTPSSTTLSSQAT